MKRSINHLSISIKLIILSACLSGCAGYNSFLNGITHPWTTEQWLEYEQGSGGGDAADVWRGNLPAAAVCIGLNSVDPAKWGGWSGNLSDCELDATRTASALRRLGVPTGTLLTKQATKQNALDGMAYVIGKLAPDGLLIVHLSGHGGQTPDTNGDETDGKDEYVCLYDGPFLDDDIAGLLSRCKKPIRILWICDTCNSGTMYRTTEPVDLRGAVPIDFAGQLIILAGCNEGDVSQSTGNGGVCTKAVLQVGMSGISPLELFDRAATIAAKSKQVMICNEYGKVTDDFRYKAFIK